MDSIFDSKSKVFILIFALFFIIGCSTEPSEPSIYCDLRCPEYDVYETSEGQCSLRIDESTFKTIMQGANVDDLATKRIVFQTNPDNDYTTNVNYKYLRDCQNAQGKSIIARYNDCIYSEYGNDYLRCTEGGLWQTSADFCQENLIDAGMCTGALLNEDEGQVNRVILGESNI